MRRSPTHSRFLASSCESLAPQGAPSLRRYCETCFKWSHKHSNPSCCDTVSISQVYMEGCQQPLAGLPRCMPSPAYSSVRGQDHRCQRAAVCISWLVLRGVRQMYSNPAGWQRQQSAHICNGLSVCSQARSASGKSWILMLAHFAVKSGKSFRRLQCRAQSRSKTCAAHYLACCASLPLLLPVKLSSLVHVPFITSGTPVYGAGQLTFGSGTCF